MPNSPQQQLRSIMSRITDLEDAVYANADPARSVRTSTDAFSSSLSNLLQSNKVTLGGESRVWTGFDNAGTSVFEVQQGLYDFFPNSAALIVSFGATGTTAQKNNLSIIADRDSIRYQNWNYDSAVVCVPMKFSMYNNFNEFMFMMVEQMAALTQPRVAIGGVTGPVSGTGTVWIRGGDTIRICDAERTAGGSGNIGDMCFDTNNLYIYTSAGWKRAVLV